MDAAIQQKYQSASTRGAVAELEGQFVNADEFQQLLVSHRRMVRVDRRADRLRGLQDLDTGEIFLTDERRLLEMRR